MSGLFFKISSNKQSFSFIYELCSNYHPDTTGSPEAQHSRRRGLALFSLALQHPKPRGYLLHTPLELCGNNRGGLRRREPGMCHHTVPPSQHQTAEALCHNQAAAGSQHLPLLTQNGRQKNPNPTAIHLPARHAKGDMIRDPVCLHRSNSRLQLHNFFSN